MGTSGRRKVPWPREKDKMDKKCKCGCRAQVTSRKASYLPGHDSKHVRNLVHAWKQGAVDQQRLITVEAANTLSNGLFTKFITGCNK